MQPPTASPSGLATTSLRPKLSARERSNSFRRKASIDNETGQPHHYHHRRHHHHDPTKGRSPSPPEGVARISRTTNTDLTTINTDGFLVPTRTVVEQSWSSFLIQHQLVLAGSVILATFLSHALIMSKERHDGHPVDWIASLTAMIPPPIWENLSQEWTAAAVGGAAMAKKWGKPRLGAYNPNEAWSSQAMALQYKSVQVDTATGETHVLYGKGWNDLYMVFVWVMIWTALREAAITFMLIPLGRSFGVGEVETTAKGMTKATGSGAKTVQGDEDEKAVNEKAVNEKKTGAAHAIRLKKEEHAREGKLLRFAEQGKGGRSKVPHTQKDDRGKN